MKPKILILLLLALICGNAQAQDTVRERDSIYYFMPHGTLRFREPLPDHPLWGQGSYLEYYVDHPMLVYGIAIVSSHRPQYIGDGGMIGDNLKCYDTSSLNLDLYAVLIQKEGNGYYRADSVKWYPRNPNRHLEYEQVVCHNHDITIDSTIPVYEFYFQTPRLVFDTFYVGVRSNFAHYDAQCNFIGYSYYQARIVGYITYMWRASILESCDTALGARNEQRWLQEHHWADRDSAYYGLSVPVWYGGVFPIIAPPADTDAVECIPVQNFRRTGYVDGRPLFAWDRLGGQQTFQISYGPADHDPDSYRIVNASASPYLLPDHELDSTVLYAARCRARCHHTCPLHDTIVWSPWSDTVQFFTGSSPTTGIWQPTVDEPSFTLSPNPTQDKVTVTLGQAAALPCVVTLRDEQGRELLRQRMEEGTSLTLSTQGLAAGLYFVTLETPQGTSTQKLVVER